MKKPETQTTQNPEETEAGTSRREFLGAGLGLAAGTAAGALLPTQAFAAPGTREDAEAKEVERWNADRQRRILLKGGCVLSLDPKVGDFVTADVLIEGAKIVEVAPNIRADAKVIDARGTIVLPGLIDSHRHCWVTCFRRAIPNGISTTWVNFAHMGFALSTRPKDVYAGNFLAGLSMINSGVTSVLDFHNSRSPEHTDAAIKAHIDSGIRAAFAYARPGEKDAGQHWPQDIRRVQREFFRSDDQLITLRLGVVEFVREQYELAREIGVGVSHDGAVEGEAWITDAPKFTPQLEEYARAGLLGPHVTMIHGTALPEKAFQVFKETGTQLSLTVMADATSRGQGDGISPIQKALNFGLLPGLSAGQEVRLPTDFFIQLRAVFIVQRLLASIRWSSGDSNAPNPMTVQMALQMATVGSSRCNGLEQKTGTLTPGKQADIIMIEADDIMTMPLNNAYGTVVLGAETSSVRNVLIAGQIKKWNHKLVGVDIERVRRLVHESRDYVAQQSKLWSTKDIIGYGPLYDPNTDVASPRADQLNRGEQK